MNRTRTITISLLLIILALPLSPAYAKPHSDPLTQKAFKVGIAAANWISTFQVTAPSSSWGIQYNNSLAWGLDPYYYSNGTITAGTNGIIGGEIQRSAYLLGGHDAGLGAKAALDAYLHSHDEKYLRIFNVYFGYFQRSQLPSSASQTQAKSVFVVNNSTVKLDDSGYWAEQTNIAARQGVIGGPSDDVQLTAAFPAAEHGNPIAATLIEYYRLTHNQSALSMLINYGNWLVRVQIKNGEYSGAYPVTQQYLLLGWKPRMYETTESAWILCELYRITRNETYLQAATHSGDYMLSRQFHEFNSAYIDGALPYEWNRTEYSRLVSTNHAGFSISAWIDLYELTGNQKYLTAATQYANWLLSMQVTPTGSRWGDHKYANDSMAVGGYYYGYDVNRREFGWRTALSLWSAAYAIPSLLTLYEVNGDSRYYESARLAMNWLAEMRFPKQKSIPLQALGDTKYLNSSAWGEYPQFYQPEWKEIEKAGIVDFVNNGRSNPMAVVNHNRTWLERTFNIDFNQINFQMANQGPQYMKMIWSWYPSLGFEPRYGADIAFGSFGIANFLTYRENTAHVRHELNHAKQMIQTLWGPSSVHLRIRYKIAEMNLEEAQQSFRDGWFSVAAVKLNKADQIANSLMNHLEDLIVTQDLAFVTFVALVLIALCLVTKHLKKNFN